MIHVISIVLVSDKGYNTLCKLHTSTIAMHTHNVCGEVKRKYEEHSTMQQSFMG